MTGSPRSMAAHPETSAIRWSRVEEKATRRGAAGVVGDQSKGMAVWREMSRRSSTTGSTSGTPVRRRSTSA
jgi:hypothetical protein